eukprot:CAMPEP_0185040332 /NCGR_PEP_ID=MMETSP1103-20130426/38263_1 /TAXON_ID=36769 /ORGANISM="Paraphysomonas bandaiensis, Strain Caron Lab Isolate" /LENGTH=333 /DNA_ID=CAMNT_0027579589 /DNA_START=87 /DNA_END=1088 /DNA_ORIENTATION=+
MNFENIETHFQSPVIRKRTSYRRTRAPKLPEPWGVLSSKDVKSIVTSMISDQREHHFKNLRSSYLRFRSRVAEWMFDLGEYFDLHPTTIHAAISYMDRIQPNEKFSTFQWQTVAICCITIASKYNEMEEDLPDLKSFSAIIEHDIPYNVALEYELWILKQMGWKLNARTPLAFLCCFSSLGVVSETDDEEHIPCGRSALDTLLQKQLSLLSTLAILDTRFKRFPASLIAAAIIYISRKTLGLQNIWNIELSEATGADPSDFLEISELLELASSDILAQINPIKSTLPMTVSPVKYVPQTRGAEESLWQTHFTPSKDLESERNDVSPYSVTDIV